MYRWILKLTFLKPKNCRVWILFRGCFFFEFLGLEVWVWTQTQTQTQTRNKIQTRQFLGFKNVLFILRYFNFSDFFLNPNIFGFWVGVWNLVSLGFLSKPKDPKKNQAPNPNPNPRTQRNQVPNPNPKSNKTQTKSSEHLAEIN